MKSLLKGVFLVAVCASCAGPAALDDARRSYNEGRGDEALQILVKAQREHPGDATLRAEYFRLRDTLISQWLVQAEVLRQADQVDTAEALYRRVQVYDPPNPRAAAGIAQIATDRRHRAVIAAADQLVKAGKYREAQDVLRPVLADNPQQRDARRLQRTIDEQLVKPALLTVQLKPTITKPISLDLREVTLRNVFEVLQGASGINFVFDRDVRTDQRTSISLRDATIEDAIRMALLTNQLEQKVLNENTVFVYPNTPQKVREYQDLVVKGFYVSNADVKQTANMIRTMVKTRDIFIDEKIGLIVIKDTPRAIRLAERLIAAQDLAEPEVMLELEVMEVSRSRLRELGIKFPDTLAIGLQGAAGIPGQLSLTEWQNRSSDLVQLSFTNPLFLFALKQQDGTSSVLANPRIRVKNKEKARIHIGDRVPVITTTAAATGGFVSESVSYLDVGLKLEVEPIISLDDDVSMKVGLEVSNITQVVKSNSGTLTYQLGTRTAATNLRLRDGETQVLAGLISSSDRRAADRVPGIGELPIAGRLFSHTLDNNDRSEIVLLITPRIVRTLQRPEAAAVEFAAGTEASTGAPRLGAVPLALPVIPVPRPERAPAEGDGAPTPAPAPSAAPGTGPAMVPFGGVQPAPQ
jgi:general secretion pathway protein D